MNFAENLILKRRNRIRDKHLQLLLKRTHQKLDYHSKNHFVESEIEEDIRFFQSSVRMFKLKKKDKNLDFDYTHIKRILRKNQEILEKRDQKS